MRPLVPVVIEQNWRNFWSTSFDDVRAWQCSTATLNVKSNSSCNRLMECLIKKFFPQPSGPLTMMGCSSASYVLKRSIFWSTQPVCTRGGRTKDRFTTSNATLVPSVLVAYELSINELKNQRIVRVWEGLASPLAHLTNKSVPQVSWEIVSKAPAHSKKEISLRNNELLVFSNVLLLPRHHVSQDVPYHAKSCGFRGIVDRHQAPCRSNPKLDGT